MTPQIERLRDHCHRLRLYQIENELTARLEQAAKKEVSYADFLDELLATEVGAKTHKHHQMRIAQCVVNRHSRASEGPKRTGSSNRLRSSNGSLRTSGSLPFLEWRVSLGDACAPTNEAL